MALPGDFKFAVSCTKGGEKVYVYWSKMFSEDEIMAVQNSYTHLLGACNWIGFFWSVVVFGTFILIII